MDIVERLRKMVGVYIGDADIDDDLNCAADEIERLREALRQIRDFGPMTVDDQRWRVASAALQPNEARVLATNSYEAEGRN